MKWTYEQAEEFLQGITDEHYATIKSLSEKFWATGDITMLRDFCSRTFMRAVDVDAIVDCF